METGLTHEPTNTIASNELKSLQNLKLKYEEVIQLITVQKRYSIGLTKLDTLFREIGSGSRTLQLLRLKCLIELGRYEECINLSNSMLKLSATSNSDVELLQLRAQCLYAMGDVENSLKHYQQALRCDPDNTAVRSEYRQIKEINDTKERGNTAYKETRYNDAIEEWERCIQLDRNNRSFISKIYSNKANAYAKLRM